jgi:hypothetical protein
MHPGNSKLTQPNTTVDGHTVDSEDRSTGTPGEFDSDKPQNLLEQGQASKNARPIASRATGDPANYLRLVAAAPTANDVSVARHTKQVCSFVLLHD